MNDNVSMRGEYLIEARTPDGALLNAWSVKNTLTDINATVRSKMLLGEYTGSSDALAIKFFAFGDSATEPTPSDTQLGNEVYRKQVTKYENPSNGVVRTTVSLETSEASFRIREIGVFCGSSATAAANSGTLISRVLVDINNNSNIVLNVIRTDTCTI